MARSWPHTSLCRRGNKPCCSRNGSTPGRVNTQGSHFRLSQLSFVFTLIYSSIDLLRRAAVMVRGAGFEIVNVDVVVILERPKIAPHVTAIRAGLANAMALTLDQVSVKGKTNEGVDAVGRGEAIAAHAVATITNL